MIMTESGTVNNFNYSPFAVGSHDKILFARKFYDMGYNLKCHKWKENIKNSKMAKFDDPGIKE